MPRDRDGRTISGVMPHRSSTIITAAGQWDARLRLISDRVQNTRPRGRGPGAGEREQPRLPDPSLPLGEHRTTTPGDRRIDHLGERSELAVPLDQHLHPHIVL